MAAAEESLAETNMISDAGHDTFCCDTPNTIATIKSHVWAPDCLI
jgi:hypothetical protein